MEALSTIRDASRHWLRVCRAAVEGAICCVIGTVLWASAALAQVPDVAGGWRVTNCYGCTAPFPPETVFEAPRPICEQIAAAHSYAENILVVTDEGGNMANCHREGLPPITGSGIFASVGYLVPCAPGTTRATSGTRICTCPPVDSPEAPLWQNDFGYCSPFPSHWTPPWIKANGPNRPCCDRGNPIYPATANKYQKEVDYTGQGAFPLVSSRFYNSVGGATLGFAFYWQHSYGRHILKYNPNVLRVMRDDGKMHSFARSGTTYAAEPDVRDTLEQVFVGPEQTGYRYYVAATEEVEVYDLNGKLQSITNRAGLTQTFVYSTPATPPAVAPMPGLLIKAIDPFGRSIDFAYDALRRIVSMTDPAGGVYSYTYDDAKQNLLSVTYPDATTRTYHYEDAVFPNALTGITDENGVRYVTWTYQRNRFSATGGSRAGGAGQHVLSGYNDNPTRATETDAFGQARLFQFVFVAGMDRLASITGPVCSDCGPGKAYTYDANGNIASRTDWNDNRTNYAYDLARNLETQRVEGLTAAGASTPQTRTISTEWHTTFRLPTRIAEPLRITTNVYDADGTACGARGALCTKSVQATSDADGSAGFGATPAGAPRAWSYTYNANGLVLTANGPRTDVADVTTYTYYANDDADPGKRGNVATVTNALGQTTTVTAYNAHGQPLSMTDANGLVTTMSYDARLRVTSRTVGSETTAYQYDGVGQLTKVTLPDGSFLAYTYDAAHRLTALEDNLGNRIAYTLDAMGNRTAEQVFDPATALAQTRTRVYSNLNRLFREIGAAGQTTEYTYDAQGNVLTVKDPLERVTANQYDALNRLAQVTDPASGVTQYGYNGLDALVSVSDPRSLVTGYTVDGLGNLTLQSSPDTGLTASTYDEAGNLLTQTDAKGQTTTYAYDALNRVTLITFQDASKQAYGYDAGTNGIGRLTSITETNPSNVQTNLIAYAYDAHGRVSTETRTVNGQNYVMAYTYDASGRLSGMTYPSGRTIAYTFDGLGRISQISTTKDANTHIVAQNIQYHPFGGAKGWTLGNGQLYTRAIDLDGRIGSYSLGNAVYALAYDAASRITSIGETANPPNTNTYGYDTLDRLSSAILPASTFGYSYDAVGNRLTKTTGAATDTYAYSGTSNRIASITPSSGPVKNFVFDANGSTTNDAVNAFGYDTRGRMTSATTAAGVTAYQVNALGQRIRKTNTDGDTVFHYDTRGRLIAETDAAGSLKREYLYLADTPVAVAQ